ncbi:MULTISPECIES: SDR family oxidoreductase [Agrobacterium tumefaciens complex]|jgi:nucleoside-diphosphate-sugar epimerase|uniref:Nucleoside-diphosphate-sugar epimerase n=1 Tax=Agrobacterium radiobacter TaxID=362 RepID=A0ABD5LGX6_AGRRD|nr:MULTISPECIES: SDR family oxidoreductase [Agrobacterium tumefaciens complex]MCP2133108.1 nucleoside-diphosphate-sugar epimerase [Rhizobium sp. SLBN-94]TGE81729.1 SDR family NAD(P)-dependent oxidoreductase [Rhizobium sp. SEMIA 439]EPR17911.1 oxidoreductase [Agrobacterium radiobacter DSM 30147]KAA1235862.1 SDR family oxidoreductase [Agrobacterium tumefaciens]KAB0459756.1 SDR family oxidoreductase [Agrobacterium tumefaciens]
MHVMIFGAGYSGKAIANALKPEAASLSGTTRSKDKFASLAAAGMTPFLFDGVHLNDELIAAMGNVTHVVQSVAPGRDGDPLLALLGGDLKKFLPNLTWVAYLSTVGVYGDHHGAWVDETTPCRPVSARSVERVAAEAAWTEAAQKANVPLSILRLSGIYGPGRNAFMNFEKGTARRLVKKDQVFNRIRVEDIGAALAFLAQKNERGIFNVTDDEPCPPQDVVSFAATLMGVEPPPEQAFETADLTPMARSFYGENKRVSNARIRDLGFDFRFPEYRLSLKQLWENGLWRG